MSNGPQIPQELTETRFQPVIEPGHTLADHLPQIPLRLMTSLPPGDPRHRAARARAPVIAKPFTPETLANALRDGERTP